MLKLSPNLLHYRLGSLRISPGTPKEVLLLEPLSHEEALLDTEGTFRSAAKARRYSGKDNPITLIASAISGCSCSNARRRSARTACVFCTSGLVILRCSRLSMNL